MNKTTQDFIRIREMGYPHGCHEWTHAETYGNHRVWRQRRNRNAFLIVAFCAALGGLSVWFSLGGV